MSLSINDALVRLAFTYGPLSKHFDVGDEGVIDICTLTRASIRGAISVFIITAVLAIYSVGALCFVLWIYALTMHAYIPFMEPELFHGVLSLMTAVEFCRFLLAVTATVICILAGLVFGAAGLEKLSKRRAAVKGKNKSKGEQSLAKQMFKAWADKLCFNVKLDL